MRKWISMLIGLVVVILSGLFFTACGGGGGGTQTGSVSLFFTDSPANVYSSVLVKVYEVNLCSDNQCQNKVKLFTNQQGLEVDLSKLNGILQYINTANIPQETYNRLEVILDKNLTIIDGSGVSHSAIFTPMQEKPNKPNTVQCDNANNKCYIRFNGTVQPFAMGKLVVDFVLKEFEVDENTNPWQVTEVKMMPLTPQTNKYKVYLSVQSVNSQNNTITGTWMGKTYTVNISSNTVCEINGTNYQGTNCTGQIQSGMCIEVKTYQDPSNLTTFTATKIEMEEPDKCANSSGPSPNYTELKGTVSSKDSQNSTFNINKYNNPIKVTPSTYCEYQEDDYMMGTQCLTNLQTGWLVEVKINSNNEAIKIEKEQ